MFSRRPDGDPIPDLSRMRRFLPFISPRRNESLVLYPTTIEVGAVLDFLVELNARRPPERPVTLFHAYLRSAAIALHERPGVNRFVAGGRLWQRNHVAISFSAKQEFADGAPVHTLKRIFPGDPQGESLEEMVDSIHEALAARRRGRETTSDKEVSFALRLPPSLLRVGMWGMHRANMLGLMPRAMIDEDPLFTSLFVANLGSVGLGGGYHHLWEYGTCSLFAVIGAIREGPDGVRAMEVRYSYDERVEDGFYAAATLDGIKARLESPEKLL